MKKQTVTLYLHKVHGKVVRYNAKTKGAGPVDNAYVSKDSLKELTGSSEKWPNSIKITVEIA